MLNKGCPLPHLVFMMLMEINKPTVKLYTKLKQKSQLVVEVNYSAVYIKTSDL